MKLSLRQRLVDPDQLVLVREFDLDPPSLSTALDADARAELELQLVLCGACVDVGLLDGGGATLGGGLQRGITERWLFAGEIGYIAGRGDDNRFNNPNGNGDGGTYGIFFDFNAHYLFPLRDYRSSRPTCWAAWAS